MDPVPVIVKHGGKKYNLEMDPSSNGETFKYQVFSVTGVEPERQKIIVKGGQLKDDADLSKLGIKAGHQFMMMGTPSGATSVFQKPKEQARFVEDMTEAEQAQSEGATPAGLQNMGNTCYLNSTLQTLRSIPELQQELQTYSDGSSGASGASWGLGGLGDLSQYGLGGLGSSTDVTASLRDLYKQMSETQEGIPPHMFLHAFRTAFPQFAEQTREGRYAQQDAEEAWSQIITTLKNKLKIKSEDASSSESDVPRPVDQSFVDIYMGGKMERIEECTDPTAIEAGEKPEKKTEETFYKLNCHVAAREILHLRDGVVAALSDTYSKTSPTLGRDAEYVMKSQLSRLPKYLPVHFVRFFWKRDVNKKAKILRKVTFPQELDVVEFCTEELKAQLIPIRDKIRELRKEEIDVERSRKRQRRMAQQEADREADATTTSKGQSASTTTNGTTVSTSKAAPSSTNTPAKGSNTTGSALGSKDKANAEPETFKTDADIEAEAATRIAAMKSAVLAEVPASLAADNTANQTGLYELRAVVTHKGPSADSGHYTAYVKKDPSKSSRDSKAKNGEAKTGEKKTHDDSSSQGNKWWWFDDDKVSEVDEDKIDMLSGGGETHSALILLYRAVDLPVMEDGEEELAKKAAEEAAAKAKSEAEGTAMAVDKSS